MDPMLPTSYLMLYLLRGSKHLPMLSGLLKFLNMISSYQVRMIDCTWLHETPTGNAVTSAGYNAGTICLGKGECSQLCICIDIMQ